jgi:hypothetical protein
MAVRNIAREQQIAFTAGPVIEASKTPEKSADINCGRDKRPDEDKPGDIRPRM